MLACTTHCVSGSIILPSLSLQPLLNLLQGHHSLTGRRATMEDRVFHYDDLNTQSGFLVPNVNRAMYAVFDGHAGDEVAQMAAEVLLFPIYLYPPSS